MYSLPGDSLSVGTEEGGCLSFTDPLTNSCHPYGCTGELWIFSTSLFEDAKGLRCTNTVSSSKSQALETHLRNNEDRENRKRRIKTAGCHLFPLKWMCVAMLYNSVLMRYIGSRQDRLKKPYPGNKTRHSYFFRRPLSSFSFSLEGFSENILPLIQYLYR